MGLQPSPLHGAPAPLDPSWPRSAHDSLPLPGGGTIGAVPTAALTAALVGLGIAGASHESGRAANVSAYAAHLASIRTAAADAAVAAWLRGARP